MAGSPTPPQPFNVPGLPGWPGLVANLGAYGVLIWLVVIQMPRQADQYALELKALRESDEQRTGRLVQALEANTAAVRELVIETRKKDK